jgi:hypothetical protein
MKPPAYVRDFRSLSVKDLIDAREHYHVHLAHLDNVQATAIGRYLIRDGERNRKDADHKSAPEDLEPRTLTNSKPEDWSQPCVLVFVDKWEHPDSFGPDSRQADSLVPPLLFLPDGRVIPTCVVQVDFDNGPAAFAAPPAFPSDLIGGGYPVFTDVQRRRHLGSIGCMVTDGDQVFALTNRHVVGTPGREVRSIIKGAEQRIGEAANLQVATKAFSEVYQGWPGERVQLNLDAGLLRVDDVNRWTAQVYGIGEIGPVVDLNTESFSLDIIGCRVRAYGSASGPMLGQILGLFYRYKSVGGTQYVSDLLVGPRNNKTPVNSRPGDSGTIWFMEPPHEKTTDKSPDKHEFPNVVKAPPLRPIAVQWGGQVVLSRNTRLSTQFALATCLSNICRELDVELIANWNTGRTEYWGELGHVKIGALACTLIDHGQCDDLADLMLSNQANIGYADNDILKGIKAHEPKTFAPLSDVADLVWRFTRKADDESNHFADMDVEGKGAFEGQTLLDLCKQQKNVHPDVWNKFYESISEDRRGALPIRVWQIFDYMVDYASDNKFDEFVCAAGIVAHYVGDACQPLHISKYHHGLNPEDKNHAKVHAVYETTMLQEKAGELISLLNIAVQAPSQVSQIKTDGQLDGQKAAFAVVQLMQRTVNRLPPIKIVNLFDHHMGRGQTDALWNALKDDTASCMADGAHTLARIWEAAWLKGRSGKAKVDQVPVADQQTLMNLYSQREFLPSYRLQVVQEKAGQIIGTRGKDATPK